MTWTYVTDVESDSRPGTFYAIKKRDDGTFGCACMAWRFNKATPRTCKHLDAFRMAHVGFDRHSTTLASTRPTISVGGETFRFRRAISFGAITP